MIGGIRRALRGAIPAPVRLRAALARRRLRDRALGRARLIVKKPHPTVDLASWTGVFSVAQAIHRADHWEGKLANLRLASERLNGAVIMPGDIYSFWALVGAPDTANGFAIGRSIRSDVLGADVGGGLCQLSGLAYELGLRSGMDVAERHAHSQDLYTDAMRFTPAWAGCHRGVGDIRPSVEEPSTISISFAFGGADRVVGTVLSPTRCSRAGLELRTDETHRCVVQTLRTRPAGARELISSDTYMLPVRR